MEISQCKSCGAFTFENNKCSYCGNPIARKQYEKLPSIFKKTEEVFNIEKSTKKIKLNGIIEDGKDKIEIQKNNEFLCYKVDFLILETVPYDTIRFKRKIKKGDIIHISYSKSDIKRCSFGV